jgi:hypothetical protein
MAVPSNHAYVKGGDDIVDALMDVVERAETVVTQAAQEAIEQQHERMQQRASQDPQWQAMAPDIQYWADEDGDLAYGVPPHSRSYQEAMRVEYGDTTNAPVPLIRMGVVNGVTQMGWSMQQAFLEQGFG